MADDMVSAGWRQHRDHPTHACCCQWFKQRRCKRCCRRGTICFLELDFWVFCVSAFVVVGSVGGGGDVVGPLRNANIALASHSPGGGYLADFYFDHW